ncbi:Diaminobutyrate--2-oxoglutarate aminotransferase [Frankia canadensis]|uniref:Diaminobutyrate--2-oxoglutarate transaminase n=1 Tax=Frankia canadensis TaxID=1836972 RepID=A0A2I2KX82_9ACTN|nr:diaminobutyrate--2-oxoglutarate transaminase family protein [Frankia canadensis]SNQ50275.1 Diaminobutyrate--2-oxoglutarate aminotransferase [Frankia canadensis]SOU57565.1 Diaminobutyrate--2-oxoglutarate aminotransferase [Frankia canadensis]
MTISTRNGANVGRIAPAVDPVGILERQQARESAARTYARTLPIVPVRAQGSVIHGADGRTYLDCLSGAGTLALGHNHPDVVRAITDTLASGAPLHTLDLATPEKDAFTEELRGCLPSGLGDDVKLHFCGPSGADAVEAAIKLAQTATGNHTILAFTGGYHGMTAGALAVTGNVAVKSPLPPGGSVVRLPFPHPYRCPFGVGSGPTRTAGPDGVELSLRYIERLLDDPLGGVTSPAGLIVEAVQGEGGVVPAPDHWLRAIREITRRRGIPLILDEVQTGVGRTGRLWATQHSGIAPDILVMSKAIGGGLPMAVIAYRAELDGWAPGAHTGTFRGNQLAMVAGTATLRRVRADRLDEQAGRLGARLLAGLVDIAREYSQVGDVRGRGLMLGAEIVDPSGPADTVGARPADPRLAAAVRSECLRRGLIVELGGRHSAVVRLLPPLTITPDQVERALSILADAIGAAVRSHPDLHVDESGRGIR